MASKLLIAKNFDRYADEASLDKCHNCVIIAVSSSCCRESVVSECVVLWEAYGGEFSLLMQLPLDSMRDLLSHKAPYICISYHVL